MGKQRRWNFKFTAPKTIWIALLVALLVLPLTPAVEPFAAQTTVAEYQQVLNQYCVVCHNEQLANGGLVMPQLSIDSIPAQAESWERVITKLHTRAMPPLEMPRPDESTYNGLLAFLEETVDAAAAANPNPGRVPAFHRLNRTEYKNAIRDILDLDYDAATLLPADDSGYGFDNIADVLTVSPMLTERYLGAARKISRLAVGDPGLHAFSFREAPLSSPQKRQGAVSLHHEHVEELVVVEMAALHGLNASPDIDARQEIGDEAGRSAAKVGQEKRVVLGYRDVFEAIIVIVAAGDHRRFAESVELRLRDETAGAAAGISHRV